MRKRQNLTKRVPIVDSESLSTINDKNANTDNEFKLERYKYILGQLQALNENAHKYLTLFQTLATAIVGGGVGIFVSRKSLDISAEVTIVSIQTGLVLLIVLACFVIVSLLGGIFSWLDYRKEEIELLNEVIRPNFRKMPKPSNFWRWFETYVLLFVIVTVVILYIFVESKIIPLIS